MALRVFDERGKLAPEFGGEIAEEAAEQLGMVLELLRSLANPVQRHEIRSLASAALFLRESARRHDQARRVEIERLHTRCARLERLVGGLCDLVGSMGGPGLLDDLNALEAEIAKHTAAGESPEEAACKS